MRPNDRTHHDPGVKLPDQLDFGRVCLFMGAGIVQFCFHGLALLIHRILLSENTFLVVVDIVPVSLVGHEEEGKDEVVGRDLKIVERRGAVGFERKVR